MSHANELIDAIGLRLKELYPDVRVTSEEAEQIKSEDLPYFFVMVIAGDGGRVLRDEYRYQNTVAVDYEVRPDMPKKNEHLNNIAESLITELENVKDIEGRPFHAIQDSQNYERIGNFVRFTVSYRYKVLVVKPKADTMTGQELESRITR